MKMALTGHRPPRLNMPEDLEHVKWKPMSDWLKEKLIELNVTDAYCGMATGCDCLYALAVIDLKKQGYNINLHCIVPCENYQRKYKYNKVIRDNANEWHVISKKYTKTCESERDQYMVDHSDAIFAIFDSIEAGGVYNTINKAKKKGIDIIYYPN